VRVRVANEPRRRQTATTILSSALTYSAGER